MLLLYPAAAKVKRRRISVNSRRNLMIRLSESQNHRCCHCGRRLLFTVDGVNSEHRHYATFEHMIPHRYGGDWSYENLAVAHKCCNEYYTDVTSVGFFKYRRMLKQKMGINLKLLPEFAGLQTIENSI